MSALSFPFDRAQDRLSTNGTSYAFLGEEAGDALGGLCAFVEPIAGFIGVDHEGGGVGTRIVVTEDVDNGAVAGGAGVGDDDTICRLLFLPDPAQPDLQQSNLLFPVSVYTQGPGSMNRRNRTGPFLGLVRGREAKSEVISEASTKMLRR
jgi:hypothetical protein